MRKVILTMTEEYEYQQVKRHVDQGGNFKNLCIKLCCSERTARRKIAGYRKEGRAFFRHKNHDNKPATTIPSEVKDEIISLYNQIYFDANFKHFKELLERLHPDVQRVSLSSLRNIMKDNDLLSPLAWRSTRKKLMIKDRMDSKVVLPEAVAVASPTLSLEPHPRRVRSKYAGEFVFLDGSVHRWFNGLFSTLHASIDDATGNVLAARFEEQETLRGYYFVFAEILRRYGIPCRFGTDGRSVFDYKRKGLTAVALDTSTQFGYACRSLGVDIRSTTCAQAQGKVERLFGTLQSRLVVELRLRGVCTIMEANEFLEEFIPMYNQQFAMTIDSVPSAFEAKLSEEEINLALAVIATRVVDNGNCISYEHSYYRFLDERGGVVCLAPKQKVLVIRAFDGRLFASCRERIFALEKVPKNSSVSSELDLGVPSIKRARAYVPDFMHPWRQKSFEAFAKENREKLYSFKELIYSTENIYSFENL